MTWPISATSELLTPFPQDSLHFFVELFGMEVEAREGQSVYLRGWGDYQRYSLKLTESALPGLGHMALRASSPEALQRTVRALTDSGRGSGWIDGDVGHGPAFGFTDPDGHPMEVYYETERYQAPPGLRPALKNVPQRFVGRGAAVKRLDHVNLLAADVTANRRFAQEQLGFRLYEQIVGDDGIETGAWMSLTIAAHELIYVADHARRAGACITLRSSLTPARNCCARRTCSSTRMSRSRPHRPSTPLPRACSCTSTSQAAIGSRSRPGPISSMTPTTSRWSGPRPNGPAARPGG